MKQAYIISYILLTLLIVAGCTPTIDPPVPSSTGLNLERVIVVGSCMSAGMADAEVRQEPGLTISDIPHGGFYPEGQQYSFANMVASSLEAAGAPPFRLPDLPEHGSGYARLGAIGTSSCEHIPMPYTIKWEDSSPEWFNHSPGTDFDNWSIPHLMLRNVLNRDNRYENPYQNWLMGSPVDSTCYCDEIMRKEATFGLVALGLEDVLYYAYNGAGNGNPYPMTDPTTFSQNLETILHNLLQKEGAKLAVLNIPDVTSMPFFTHMPTEQYDPQTCEEVPILIRTMGGNTRPATPADRILMSASHPLRNDFGPEANPLPEKYVLDEEEIAEIRKYIRAYNDIINDLAAELNHPTKRAIVVDMHVLYNNIEKGSYFSGVKMDNEYIFGGFYSLDGLMPSPQGHAVIANTIVETLVRHYPELNIPRVSVVSYPSVRIP
jgi:lysophospholipase L1-like esterase